MTTAKIIELLNAYQARLYVSSTVNGKKIVEPAPPAVLAANLLLIRGLLIQLLDPIADSERAYRSAKGARFDQLIKEGVKKSPAFDQLDLDEHLCTMKIEVERLKNYMKYVDGLCTSVQSVLKQQTASDKNQY